MLQIVIGQHDAAIAGARWAAIRIAGRAMQPDALSSALVLFVPLVRVTERESTAAIHIGQFVFGQLGIDEVHAYRGALIAFRNFLGAQFAYGDVIVGDILG